LAICNNVLNKETKEVKMSREEREELDWEFAYFLMEEEGLRTPAEGMARLRQLRAEAS
jgi:hypothetical protein